ncbi:hypothetical protein BDN70DRAFT_940012 [Pholiota conissans]|uniref:Uncharacterized protein n=1 Tax=Pholiota conissans TaxID=109636 RepID=A0A9P5YJB3_9AGAR|nr:hypothetical protein BDN70DRAFT_940012 [Pholiota conissans]
MGRDQMREDLPPRQRKGNAPVTATSKEDVAITTLTKALLSMSFGKVDVNTDADTGIVDLANLLASSKGTFANLPSNFDHSAASSAPLSLASDTLEVLVASSGETPVYLLRNSGGRLCDDPWMIATGDASTVLLVFRKKWATVDIIARELVRRGTRFNTVRAVANRPETASPPVRTLGLRPSGYKPTREDYQEYVRRRNNLLQGSKGCAALKWGGIIARIARDVLPDQGIVLDGPVTGDCVICEYNKLFFVDDQLTETEKNFICGIYVSQTEDAPEGELLNGTRVDISWWPKDSMWQTLNCYLTLEWTELAETFYQKRKRDIEAELSMINASGWRLYLRKANTWTKKVEAGAEYYQRGYLDHCLAAAVSRL